MAVEVYPVKREKDVRADERRKVIAELRERLPEIQALAREQHALGPAIVRDALKSAAFLLAPEGKGAEHVHEWGAVEHLGHGTRPGAAAVGLRVWRGGVDR